MMNANQFVSTARWIAEDLPSLYVMGGFGAVASAVSRARYTGPNAHEYNKRPAVKAAIQAAANGTFFFDCVGLIKGILWGFSGDTNKTYGGGTVYFKWCPRF